MSFQSYGKYLRCGARAPFRSQSPHSGGFEITQSYHTTLGRTPWIEERPVAETST
jgi:hypothetical protein